MKQIMIQFKSKIIKLQNVMPHAQLFPSEANDRLTALVVLTANLLNGPRLRIFFGGRGRGAIRVRPRLSRILVDLSLQADTDVRHPHISACSLFPADCTAATLQIDRRCSVVACRLLCRSSIVNQFS